MEIKQIRRSEYHSQLRKARTDIEALCEEFINMGIKYAELTNHGYKDASGFAHNVNLASNRRGYNIKASSRRGRVFVINNNIQDKED